MPRFSYQAKNSTGRFYSGQIDASSEADAKVRLKNKDLNVVRLAEVVSLNKRKSIDETKKINTKDLQIFTRQFSTLLNAGIPIVDCLKILGEGRRHSVLKEVINKIKESIEGGKSLGESMAVYPGVFDRLYVNMVRAGEEAGILDNILDRLSVYMEKTQKIKHQVKGALAYPVIIIIVAFVVIAGMLIFIIPKFQEMYASAGKKLPGLTQMVINISEFVIYKYHVLTIGLLGIGYMIYAYFQTPEGRKEWDRLLIGTPLIGDVIQKTSIARMSRTLSTLLNSGIGVVDALEIASRTSGNIVIEQALLRSKEYVIAGRPLAVPLSKERVIPGMVSQMISIGERSGTLDFMLGKVADFYEDDVEAAIKTMTSLVEPILMVFLGGIIAILVLAMYLPIFDMASLSGG